MNQDSLTPNANLLPQDNASLFKNLVRSQDEVPEGLRKTFFVGNAKDVYPGFYVRQTRSNTDSYCTSVFYTGKKNFSEFRLKEITNKYSDINFYLLLFCLVTGAVIFFLKHKRISQIFKAFYLPHFTNQLVREGLIQREFFAFPLLLVYYISLSLLITRSLHCFFAISTGFNTVLQVLGILLALAIIRGVTMNFAKWCFRTPKETSEYRTNNFIFSIITGLFLVPMVFLIYYLQAPLSVYFLYIVLAVTGLMILYRIIRSFFIGLTYERFNLYYFILYLCTIEILPLVITLKLLINFYLKGVLIV
ncbi:MAG TPA: DUF4271 domain-containing protein [Bacteroidales bacterium]|nr:DUF4271 domain-containing protein [Bacteroidales bacterium]